MTADMLPLIPHKPMKNARNQLSVPEKKFGSDPIRQPHKGYPHLHTEKMHTLRCMALVHHINYF